MIETIIFDMDGVLIESGHVHNTAYDNMFKYFGIEVNREIQHRFIGKSLTNTWQEYIVLYQLPVTVAQAYAIYLEHFFTAAHQYPIRCVEYAKELLDILRDCGRYKIVLASSAPAKIIRYALEMLALEKYFGACISGDDIVLSKPHPEIFLRAAAAVNSNPANCVVIEDSANGVLAAKSAGMYCAAYINPNSGKQDLSRADFPVKHHAELSEILLNFKMNLSKEKTAAYELY